MQFVAGTTAITAPPIQQAGITEPLLPAGVRKSYAGKFGHELDYSWITGQLFYIHADGGLWVLRYAGVDSEDRFGGSVVLAYGQHEELSRRRSD